MSRATLLGGIPAANPALFHRVRFPAGDPAAWIDFGDQSLFIVRDIEVERARKQVRVDRVAAPSEFAPPDGLDADRATAVAQAVAEAIRQQGVQRVTTDRTLPFIYAWHLQQLDIEVEYDAELGVLDRRAKSDEEIDWLAEAQRVTEAAMEMACGMIAGAAADAEGRLQLDGATVTSERVKSEIVRFLAERGYQVTHGSIVATAPQAGDCHDGGSGPLRTETPVIIDIFPTSEQTHYCGDCTRTVVHGAIPDEVARMHAAVVAAKAAAIEKCRVGTPGDAVHAATKKMLAEHGYRFARGETSDEAPIMPHGTGHGIGLEIHEPILLDDGGPEIVRGECLTVEPGLYSRTHGGVRVEDMIVVLDEGPRNLNRLPEGLHWE